MTSSTKPIHDQINECENFADLAIVVPEVYEYEDALNLLKVHGNLNPSVAYSKYIEVQYLLRNKVINIQTRNQN